MNWLDLSVHSCDGSSHVSDPCSATHIDQERDQEQDGAVVSVLCAICDARGYDIPGDPHGEQQYGGSRHRIRRGADPCMAQDKHVCGVACFVCDCVYTGAIYVRYHTNFTEMAKICKKNHWIKFAFFPIYLYNKANSVIQ